MDENNYIYFLNGPHVTAPCNSNALREWWTEDYKDRAQGIFSKQKATIVSLKPVNGIASW